MTNYESEYPCQSLACLQLFFIVAQVTQAASIKKYILKKTDLLSEHSTIFYDQYRSTLPFIRLKPKIHTVVFWLLIADRSSDRW